MVAWMIRAPIKTYRLILSLMGLALTVFAQCTSLTDGRQLNLQDTGSSWWCHFWCGRNGSQIQPWAKFDDYNIYNSYRRSYWRNARFTDGPTDSGLVASFGGTIRMSLGTTGLRGRKASQR